MKWREIIMNKEVKWSSVMIIKGAQMIMDAVKELRMVQWKDYEWCSEVMQRNASE